MKSHSLTVWGLSAVIILCGYPLSGCRKHEKPKPPPQAQQLIDKMTAGEEKRRAMQAKYRAMNISELVKQLETDARNDVEPFNSSAYRELLSRGPKAAGELASQIKGADRSSLLALLALRKIDTKTYKTVGFKLKVEVYIDALRTSKFFNTWGIPHLYWEDAAKALMEQGEAAVGPLRALLRDKRDAPLWGSEEVMEYEKFRYRVCDYAWAMLMEIHGKKVKIPEDPKARDRLMSQAG